jgi:aspartyl-tRNA synthetase
MLRTHTCGELTAEAENNEVTLCGWVDRKRDIGHLYFLSLRDRFGVTQCIFESDDPKQTLFENLKSLGLEDCVQVMGRVRQRTTKDKNSEMATGEIEVVIDDIQVLNPCAELPFQVKDEAAVALDLRLKYRYLDLRRPSMQRNLRVRHQVIQATRSALTEIGFLEIETPLLIRSTPEGARDFVVPSRAHPGKFYALPQSPQLYKQMLMISGCDRYFQFAPAFRDEDLRADRTPVHTQVDMEMTFVEESDVFRAVEHYLSRVFSEVAGVKITPPFNVLPYREVMERFGSDKPDLRFGLELKTVSAAAKKSGFKVFAEAACVRALVVQNGDTLPERHRSNDRDRQKARSTRTRLDQSEGPSLSRWHRKVHH